MRYLAIIAALAISAAPAAAAETAAKEHTVHQPDQLTWQAAPPALPQGAEITVLRGDPTADSGTFTMRLRVPAGYVVAPHSHPTDENLTLIDGSMHYGKGETADTAQMTELPTGTYIFLPANHSHFVRAGDQGFVLEIQAQAPFDLKYANPTDDPRQEQAKAATAK